MKAVETFPVESVLPAIASSLAANRTVVLRAPPGSGKTTCVPPALLSAPWLDGKRILMLEPRRLAARGAAARLVTHGIPVSSQTVLLKGVNDTPRKMMALLRALSAARIRPYYVFMCDPVSGLERFRVPLADPDLAFLPIAENDGHNYFTDMLFALRYAKENRRRMMEAMKETLAEFVPGVNFVRTIDIHHNYAAFEEHFGEKVCVHRKGVTSAKLDEIGIIPGSMGTASYIVRGLGNPDSFMSCSHGAGRRMSRVAASTTLTVEECDKAMDGIVCERWHKYKGFGKAKGRLDLSEAPQAYKDIEDVIASELDLVEPLVRLVPLASLKG